MIRTLRPASQTVISVHDAQAPPTMKDHSDSLFSSTTASSAAKKDSSTAKENTANTSSTTLLSPKKLKPRKINPENKMNSNSSSSSSSSSKKKSTAIPQIMEWDDVKLGNVVGTGEFGVVVEVLSIANCPEQLQTSKEQYKADAGAEQQLLSPCPATPKNSRLKLKRFLLTGSTNSKSKPQNNTNNQQQQQQTTPTTPVGDAKRSSRFPSMKRYEGANDTTLSTESDSYDVGFSTMAMHDDTSERDGQQQQQQQQQPFRLVHSRRGAALLHHHNPASSKLPQPDKALTSLTEVNELLLDECTLEEEEDDNSVSSNKGGDAKNGENVASSAAEGVESQGANDISDNHHPELAQEQDQEPNDTGVTVKLSLSNDTITAAAAVAASYHSEDDDSDNYDNEEEDHHDEEKEKDEEDGVVHGHDPTIPVQRTPSDLSSCRDDCERTPTQQAGRRIAGMVRQDAKNRDWFQESSMDFCVLMGIDDSSDDEDNHVMGQGNNRRQLRQAKTSSNSSSYESEEFVPTVQLNNFESANMKQLRANMDHVRRVLCSHTSSRSLSYNFFMDSTFADDATTDDIMLTPTKDNDKTQSSQAMTANVIALTRGVDRNTFSSSVTSKAPHKISNSIKSALLPQQRQRPYVLKTIQKSLRWDVQLLHARDIVEEAHILTVAGQHENIVSLRATVGRPGSANFGLILDRVTEILDDTLVAWKEQRKLHQQQQQNSQANVTATPAHKRNFLLPWRLTSSTAHNKDNDVGGIGQEGAGSLLTAERVLAMFDVAKAMCHLHQHRIIYRDLKPGNIGVDVPTGRVKLFDFGSAVHISDKNKNANNNNTNSGKHALVDEDAELYRLTNQVGTSRCYMAPEVARPKTPYGFQADVYSFAILFWHVMALQVPFEHIRTNEEHFERVVTNQERPPSLLDASTSQANEQLCPDLPYGLEQMMQAAWHDSPVKRPTFLDICQTLQSEFLCQESFQHKTRE